MRCIRCGQRGAYSGARFCGAGCSARFEGGDAGPVGLKLLARLFVITFGVIGALLFVGAWSRAIQILLGD